MNWRRFTIGTATFLVLVLPLIAWLLPPFPNEQYVIALYTARAQQFAAVTKMIESNCGGQLRPETVAAANRINPRMRVFCDYDGTVRFILGERGLMAIGPERVIGLTFIPGDPARKGSVVPVLGPHAMDVGEVYLRQVDNRWYVFSQNTD